MNRTDCYERGWSHRSQRCRAVISGSHGQRISMISAITTCTPDCFIAPMIFMGYCTRELIEGWLERLCQNLEKDQFGLTLPHVLLLDNASFNKGGNIVKIAAQYNCRLVYLPAYSPDMNPIEQRWFVLKNRIRVLRSQGIDFMSAIEQAFKEM